MGWWLVQSRLGCSVLEWDVLCPSAWKVGRYVFTTQQYWRVLFLRTLIKPSDWWLEVDVILLITISIYWYIDQLLLSAVMEARNPCLDTVMVCLTYDIKCTWHVQKVSIQRDFFPRKLMKHGRCAVVGRWRVPSWAYVDFFSPADIKLRAASMWECIRSVRRIVIFWENDGMIREVVLHQILPEACW
jgi:hypothetical protein